MLNSSALCTKELLPPGVVRYMVRCIVDGITTRPSERSTCLESSKTPCCDAVADKNATLVSTAEAFAAGHQTVSHQPPPPSSRIAEIETKTRTTLQRTFWLFGSETLPFTMGSGLAHHALLGVQVGGFLRSILLEAPTFEAAIPLLSTIPLAVSPFNHHIPNDDRHGRITGALSLRTACSSHGLCAASSHRLVLWTLAQQRGWKKAQRSEGTDATTGGCAIAEPDVPDRRRGRQLVCHHPRPHRTGQRASFHVLQGPMTNAVARVECLTIVSNTPFVGPTWTI